MAGRRAGLRCVGSVMLLLFTGVGGRAAGPTMQWVNAESLSRSDRAQIVALLRRAGLGAPEKVTFVEGWTGGYVEATSSVSVRGARRRWNWVQVDRRSERSPCGQVDALCEPRWWVPYPLQRSETWRVTDGAWFRDVELGPRVKLADVEPLMRGMHRGELVDARQRDPNWPPEIAQRTPNTNADEVFLIERGRSGFEVSVGLGQGNDILDVRERDGRYELVGWSEIVY